MIASVQVRHPGLRKAVMADFAIEAKMLDISVPSSRVGKLVEIGRLCFITDAFGALVLYRLKAACQRQGIPVIPHLAHRAAIAWGQVSIGDAVLVHPGIRLPHGQVVIGGFAEIHSGVEIRPFVTIGLREGILRGPTIHRDVRVGTGAKVIGRITVGRGARIGANAVVIHDVPPGAVVVGVPAHVVPSQ